VRKPVVTRAEVDDAWTAFLRLREDKEDVERTVFGVQRLEALSRGCCNLKEVLFS